MFVCLSVRLSFCLSVCLSDVSQLFKNFFETNTSRDPSKDTATILTVEGRVFDVQLNYVKRLENCTSMAPSLISLFLLFPLLPRPVANYVTSTVETVLALHREERAGDVLAFLTGQEEVETAVSQLKWVWPLVAMVFCSNVPPFPSLLPENTVAAPARECSCHPCRSMGVFLTENRFVRCTLILSYCCV